MRERNITASAPKENKISDFVLQKGQVHKLLCMGKVGAITDLTHTLKGSFPGLSAYCSEGTYLEIMNEAVSKSGAVKHLYGAYGILAEAIVPFGDNFGDIDILLATGICFVIGNAPPRVRRQIRNVTEDNNHEGMLAGLERLNFVKNRT